MMMVAVVVVVAAEAVDLAGGIQEVGRLVTGWASNMCPDGVLMSSKITIIINFRVK